ncbi:MAG: DUF58 domain-containing protein [Elusimicrobia bacterium]|nr:DUF58 domain-containing protein [Elusimicrobiota bacterium]
MDRLRFLGLRLAWGLLRRLRGRLTLAGWLAFSGGAASGALGIDTNATMAYQGFTFLAALLLTAWLSGLLFRPLLSLRRALPRFATAGQPLPVSVQVENQGRAALRGLTLQEDVPVPQPSWEEFAAEAPAVRSRLDRLFGLSRWVGLCARLRGAEPAQAALPDLPPGGGCSATLRLTPARRGVLRLERLAVSRPDPLGLVTAFSRRPAAGSVLVLPRRYPVPRLALPGGRRYQQGGVALSSSVGESPEFVSLRDYRPGDPLRRIHWKSQARTGKLIVKEYQEEYFVRHALVLDTFAGPGAVFEEAVSVAASFAASVLTQESLLDLLFVADQAYCVTAGRSLAGEERMLEVLAGVGPCPGRSFSVLTEAVLRRRAGLSAALCVLQSWDEPRRALVRGLRAVGIPAVAMVVVPAGGGPLEAADGPVHRLEAGRIAEGLAEVRV